MLGTSLRPQLSVLDKLQITGFSFSWGAAAGFP